MKILSKINLSTIKLGLVLSAVFLSASVLNSCSGQAEEAQAQTEKVASKPENTPEKEKQKINVEVMPVKKTDIDDTITISGNVHPWKAIKVSSESNGKVIKMNIDEGSYVKAGQVILETEHDTILAQIKQVKASYAQAQAALKQAKVNYEMQKKILDGEVYVRTLSFENNKQDALRDKKLAEDSVITKKQLDDKNYDRNIAEVQLELSKVNKAQQTENLKTNIESSQAQLKNLEAQLELLEIQLAKSYIKSPSSGIVDKTFTDPGELISQGSPVIDILEMDKVKITGGIPERDLPSIKHGSKVQVKLDAYPDKTFMGEVIHISSSADPSNKTFPVKIALNNTDYLLKPGMIARFTLIRQTYEDAVLIPRTAVMRREFSSVVFVENNGVVSEKTVELGGNYGKDVHILKGLSENDRLVVTGQQNLADTVAVNVVKVK